MHTTYAHAISRRRARYASVAGIVSLAGPLTAAGGVIWGILQPWRVTLLHPHGEGLWWLLIEPPVLVAAAGILFAVVVARPLLTDLEEHRAATR